MELNLSPRTRAALYTAGILLWGVPMVFVGLGWFRPANAWFGWGMFVLGLGLVLGAFARFTPPPTADEIIVADPQVPQVRVIDLREPEPAPEPARPG